MAINFSWLAPYKKCKVCGQWFLNGKKNEGPLKPAWWHSKKLKEMFGRAWEQIICKDCRAQK